MTTKKMHAATTATVSALVLLLVTAFGVSPVRAGTPPEADREAILAMAGSYEVRFSFEETAAYEAAYDEPEPHRSSGIEWVTVVADEPEFISLQHILVTPRGVVKHWRQDWLYENRVLFEYHAGRTWKRRTLTDGEVEGTWTQRVFQVDDSPRYEAIGTWTHYPTLSTWESERTRRPLPRREFTKRDDYDVLLALNRHSITPNGWLHEQDNLKVVLDENGEVESVIARELGANTYSYVREELLEPAREYWRTHGKFWEIVRERWDEAFREHDVVSLHAEREDKRLYHVLFALHDEVEGARSSEIRSRVDEAITSFLVDEGEQGAPGDGYE